MTAAFILLAVIGISAAAINVNEIIREPSTKGWCVGIGFLVFVVFGAAAIWTGA